MPYSRDDGQNCVVVDLGVATDAVGVFSDLSVAVDAIDAERTASFPLARLFVLFGLPVPLLDILVASEGAGDVALCFPFSLAEPAEALLEEGSFRFRLPIVEAEPSVSRYLWSRCAYVLDGFLGDLREIENEAI